MSLATAKYITKYTHKGPDRSTLELRQHNEVSDFKDSRYIAASEAAWCIFEFPIHHQEPAVMSLQVHLPEQHMVLFNANESPQIVSSRAEREQTMLTGYFRLNQLNHSAHCFTFQEIPLHFIWDPKKKGMEKTTMWWNNWPNDICLSYCRQALLPLHSTHCHQRFKKLGGFKIIQRQAL